MRRGGGLSLWLKPRWNSIFLHSPSLSNCYRLRATPVQSCPKPIPRVAVPDRSRPAPPSLPYASPHPVLKLGRYHVRGLASSVTAS